MSERQRRWVELFHYLAATVLMVVALTSVDGWLPVVSVIAAYFAVCATEGLIQGSLQFYLAADRSKP